MSSEEGTATADTQRDLQMPKPRAGNFAGWRAVHEPPICARVAMTSTAVRRDDLCSRRHLPALRRYTAERSSVIAASGTSWMWRARLFTGWRGGRRP
jgi:hypothetical protein